MCLIYINKTKSRSSIHKISASKVDTAVDIAKGPVTIRMSCQITSIGRLGVGGFKPVDVIISFGGLVIELKY